MFILKMKKHIILLSLLFPFNCLAQEAVICNGKPILGKTEQVLLIEKNLIVEAKIDTGATMSSLSASNIKEVKHHNKPWIEFSFNNAETNQKLVFRAPLVGYIKILKRSDEIKISKQTYGIRPVILMNVCIGNNKKQIEVNLIDRSQFKYPMLIGTQALEKFNVVIDTNRKFVTQPNCTTKQ